GGATIAGRPGRGQPLLPGWRRRGLLGAEGGALAELGAPSPRDVPPPPAERLGSVERVLPGPAGGTRSDQPAPTRLQDPSRDLGARWAVEDQRDRVSVRRAPRGRQQGIASRGHSLPPP